MRKLTCTLLFLSFITSIFCISGRLLISSDLSYTDKSNYTLPEEIPQISSVKTVHKNQKFAVIPEFRGMANDKDNHCDVVYDLKVVKPNGQVWFEKTDLNARKGVLDSKDMAYSASLVYKMAFEDEDATGTYTIITTFKDLVGKQDFTTKSKIKLEEQYKKYKCNKEILDDYINDYYKNPEPEKAIDYYLYVSDIVLSGTDAVFTPGMAFFAYIFNNNEYLIPHLYEVYPKQSQKTKESIILLLSKLNYDSKDFMNKLSGLESQYYGIACRDTSSVTVPEGEITDVSELTKLWGEFFATGCYKPIYRIVSALDNADYHGVLDEYGTSEITNPDGTVEIIVDASNPNIKALIYGTAQRALEGNYYSHELVYNYCNYMMMNEPLSESQKAALTKISDDYIKDRQSLKR